MWKMLKEEPSHPCHDFRRSIPRNPGEPGELHQPLAHLEGESNVHVGPAGKISQRPSKFASIVESSEI